MTVQSSAYCTHLVTHAFKSLNFVLNSFFVLACWISSGRSDFDVCFTVGFSTFNKLLFYCRSELCFPKALETCLIVCDGRARALYMSLLKTNRPAMVAHTCVSAVRLIQEDLSLILVRTYLKTKAQPASRTVSIVSCFLLKTIHTDVK